MKIFLAVNPQFRQVCEELIKDGGKHIKLFLAGGVESLKSDMKLFLAESGGVWEAYFDAEQFAHAYILQSFFYADDFTERFIIPNAKEFLLDSGAFSFCASAKDQNINFEEFLYKYADFINRNKIDHFFELDVDSITGYDKVKQYRKRLEQITGKQCIPVWHPSRGKEEFIKHCEEYSYVSLGGYAASKGKGKKQKEYVSRYPWFISEAHKRGAKIHGLGFTSLTGLEKCHFDSVDSTAWVTGNRFGYLYFFKDGKMTKRDTPKGMRLKDAKTVAFHNYKEWVKFQQWADTHL